jgi:propionate CoA-transferase
LTAGGLEVRAADGWLTIVTDGRFQKFVAETQHVTFNGRRAAEQGQEIWYVTERCVFRLGSDGLVLVEVAPGVDVDRDIRSKVGFPLQVSPDCTPMDGRIFRAEAMGLAVDWT